jgi:PAS domain S-box-containing protein
VSTGSEAAGADLEGLAALAARSSDAVVIKTPDGYIVEWNAAAEHLYGYARREVVGKPISVIGEAGQWAEMLGLIKAVTSGHPVQNLRTVRRGRRGVELAVEITGIPIWDSAGTARYIMTVARELGTQEVRERFLASLVETSTAAIIGKTVAGNVISWNQGAEHLYGYSPHEAIGRHISFLAPTDRMDEVPRLMRRILDGEEVEQFRTIRRTKTGTAIEVILTLSAIRDSSGELLGISTVAKPAGAESAPASERSGAGVARALGRRAAAGRPGRLTEQQRQPGGSPATARHRVAPRGLDSGAARGHADRKTRSVIY